MGVCQVTEKKRKGSKNCSNSQQQKRIVTTPSLSPCRQARHRCELAVLGLSTEKKNETLAMVAAGGLALVVPCYNEEERLRSAAFVSYLAETPTVRRGRRPLAL